MATVTIILPTYERARFIGEAIESALAQTYVDFVLSIGDNSSTADTESIVRQYTDPRIRYRRHPDNLGAQGNWLELIRSADTPFVATLHDDDQWHPDLLEKLVPPMVADPSIAMSFGDVWLVGERGNRLEPLTQALSARTHRDRLPSGKLTPDRDDALRIAAVWNAPQPAVCAVIRRDLLLDIDFPDDIAPVYDLWTDYQIARRRAPLWFVRERLVDYRCHEGSSSSSVGYARSEDAIFRRILADNTGSPVLDEVRRYWATLRWSRAVGYLRDGDRASSQAEFLAARPDLPAPKQVVAAAAGRSALAWHVLRLARKVGARG